MSSTEQEVKEALTSACIEYTLRDNPFQTTGPVQIQQIHFSHQPNPEGKKYKDATAARMYRQLQGMVAGPERQDFTVRQKVLSDAYRMMSEAFEGEKRRSGDRVSTHSLANAILLAQEGITDINTIAASLLHDVVEDTKSKPKPITLQEISEKINPEVAELVDAVTKVDRTDHADATADAAEARDTAQHLTLNKLLQAMKKNRHAIYIKLADVLHNQMTAWWSSPESRERKAHLALEFYEPLARRIGLKGIAKQIGEYAFANLYPEMAVQMAYVRDTFANGKLMRILSQTIDEWSKIHSLDTFPLEYESIAIEKPTTYEIYQRTVNRTEPAPTDFLPKIRISCRNTDQLSRWYTYLREKYPLQEGETDTHPISLYQQGSAVTRLVPFAVNSGIQNITIELVLRETEIMPVDLDRDTTILAGTSALSDPDFQLAWADRRLAQEKFDLLIDSYEQAVRERRRPRDLIMDVQEALRQGSVPIYSRDGHLHAISITGTYRDFAHILGRNLGNDAYAAYILRPGTTDEEQVPLGQQIEPGVRVRFASVPKRDRTNHPIMPHRYDEVTLRKSIGDIYEGITVQQAHQIAVEATDEDARIRGVEIFLWLYRMNTGEALDIAIDHAFTPEYINQFTSLDNMKRLLGYEPRPAMTGGISPTSAAREQQLYDQWKLAARSGAGGSPLIGHVFRMIEALHTLRHSLWTMRIHLPDSAGELATVSGIARQYGGSIMPVTAGPDHFGQGKQPAVVEAVFSQGNRTQVLAIADGLTEYYRVNGIPGVRVEIVPPRIQAGIDY